jgi:hypothetical protein
MAKDGVKYNRGDVAEGILGAALTAKFINRPESFKKNNVPLTKKMIDDVLNKFFKSAKIITYKPKDILMKKGKFAVDQINFSINLPQSAFNLLSNPKDRLVVDDLYDSAIDYIETTWKEEVLSFALNGVVDKVDINSDGVGDQKGTKADIKIKINDKLYSRQISLKVKGGDQFAQVTGHDFSKQKVLWEDILNLDISQLEDSYNDALKDYDSSEVFSSREDVKVEAFKKMLKAATAIAYKDATKQIQNQIATKNKTFFVNLTRLIIEGATKGDLSIELVKLEKKTHKQLSFGKDFEKMFSDKLKNSNLKAVYRPTGDPVVQIYAGNPVKANLILQIRPKIAAESRTLKSGKVYSPYIRNLIESGPMLFKL